MARKSEGSGTTRAHMHRRLELLWGTKEGPSRGPRPSVTLEQIVEAAIEIAAAEGVSELSMRRVAERIGLATMSLYRYVRSKDELVDLMLDALVGEPPDLDTFPGGWREKLECWARREWKIFQRYPWALRLVPEHFLMGPNRIGWLEAALRALHGTGLEGREMLDAVNVVDRYVRGTALELSVRDERTDTRAAWWPTHAPFLGANSRDTKYAAVVEVFETATAPSPNVLEFGLSLILDGIEALIDTRSAKGRRRK